jgi:hypothetical protein
MAYDNRLKGILSRNERQRPGKKDPDFQGSCEMEDGKQYWISGWIRDSGPQSKTPGKRFFSLSFTAKEAAPPVQAHATSTPPVATAQPAQKPNDDEDVPF